MAKNRIGDDSKPPALSDFARLADRSADAPLDIPEALPALRPKTEQPRFAESHVYPYLETNVDALAMEFSREPIPEVRSAWTVGVHGADSPFRPWTVLRGYVEGLVRRNGYEDFVEYKTSVERVEKVGEEWKVTLRKDGKEQDYWWVEWFDAVVVASGHYWVPYIPAIDGLEQFEKSRPGSVLHSKHFRGRNLLKDKRVVVVGASVSAADIAVDLIQTAETPVHAIVIGHTANTYFGDAAFDHPKIEKHPSITRIAGRTVHLADGSSIADVDNIIFGTGFSWTLPFLPAVPVRNNRVPDLFQHVVWRHDPTLLFVGAVGAGLTFKIFEWQAVYAARLLAGRGTLPSPEAMEAWEAARIGTHGDGPKFTVIFPDFEDYFDGLRALAGEGAPGVGRKLPKFQREWHRAFLTGTDLRRDMWKRQNEAARAAEEEAAKATTILAQARL
ncbi:hypothetical protein B0J13DRAFT_112821 [Dactylonectria estremocensis]|uniref:Uncharacterized protein n=1 Tax=Dactylonectria estremocensis TaxID=1079267 RepID=A0A9P9JC06_9HYPO|nr:hypothetical protein B0J13DRAFT_112821 [Dactylonectria estremocensis]